MPVTLTVTSANAAALSVTNSGSTVANAGTSRHYLGVWFYTLTTLKSLTLLSSNYPISFTAASAVAGGSPEDWILLSAASGIAYNYGTGSPSPSRQDALMNSPKYRPLRSPGAVTITYASTNVCH